MKGHPPACASNWNVGVRIWVERAGQAVLGKGRLELLEGIDRHHSISAAAREMGMSYRRAWLLVQSINAAAGFPLVEAEVGGSHGGGARLTDRGREALTVFRLVQEHMGQAAATALQLPAPLDAGTIHVGAAVSLEEVLNQLLADYQAREPGQRVRAVYGASDELADLLLRPGSPLHLFLSADAEPMDRLESAGVIDPRSRVLLAENRLAVVGPPGTQVARIRSAADLRGHAVRRLAMAGPGTPLGRYSQAFLRAEGVYQELEPRILWVDNPRGVIGALQAGWADAGIVYQSDALSTRCPLLFRVRQSPRPIHYWAGLTQPGPGSTSARQLLGFLTSVDAARRFRRCGFVTTGKSLHSKR